ncbi:PH domain-containing protein [Nocardiopsis sp. NRRL B-16309]|uniref:PH domain-containing protein n=1 Tax=Nocardiopsis sp. NRRL B-16309 TaxID=1519494 RepID=UPI0006AE3D72|nr:PH domain-containing protein [Nocardiopsis sp. NRRL B-16309]KOX07846.1 membrane protein [Nocardiopsis sp. NRRL B-16309]
MSGPDDFRPEERAQDPAPPATPPVESDLDHERRTDQAADGGQETGPSGDTERAAGPAHDGGPSVESTTGTGQAVESSTGSGPEAGSEPSETGSAPEEHAGPGSEPAGDWQGLHPLSVWAGAVAAGIFLVPTAVIGTAAIALFAPLPWWALAPIPGTIALLAFFTSIDLLRLRATRFRVTAERVEMRSGVVAKAYRSIPRERVRTVDVNAPIFVRVFGLCSVTVGTGEQGGSDQFQLLYVTAGQGERLRRELLLRRPATGAGAATTGTDGSADDTEETEETGEVELARLNRAWFAYAPATTATLGIGVGFIAALVGFNAQTGGWAWEWASEQANLPTAEELTSMVMTRLLVVVPASLLVLLLSGVVVLTAVAVETWWNYRLTREADGSVRLRRGLLTSVSLSVEGRRLNGVTLHQPFVLRSVGGADVRAVATGLAAADDEKTSAKSRLSPPMPVGRARALAAALLREDDSPLDVPLARHPRAALRRRFTRAGVVALLGVAVSIALAWLHTLATQAWWEAVHEIEEEIIPVPLASRAVETTPSWGWAFLAVLVAVVAFWYAVGSYRGLGHGTHPRFLVVRSGMATRDTVALERSAVIGWRITRSPFQRRVDLADVAATTAAGQRMYAAKDVGLEQGLVWADAAVPDLLAPFLVREDGAEGESGGSGGQGSRETPSQA